MGYRAVALSQVDGSGAESIGRDVAQQLGFGYLNEAIVAQVASDRGVDPAMIDKKPAEAQPWTYREWIKMLAWHEAHHQGQAHLALNLFKQTK